MATEKILLVRNDTRPQVVITLYTEVSGENVDARIDEAEKVLMYFRARGDDSKGKPLQLVILNDGIDGEVVIHWPEGFLDVEPGEYEAEIEVFYTDGTRHTAYEKLRFKVRDQVA